MRLCFNTLQTQSDTIYIKWSNAQDEYTEYDKNRALEDGIELPIDEISSFDEISIKGMTSEIKRGYI